MLIITTSEIPGREILQCLGIVSANATTSSKAFDDIFANNFKLLANNMRKKDREFDVALAQARRSVMEIMVSDLENTEADAIIGVSFDLEVVKGLKNSVFLVSGFGTAVVTKPSISFLEQES